MSGKLPRRLVRGFIALTLGILVAAALNWVVPYLIDARKQVLRSIRSTLSGK